MEELSPPTEKYDLGEKMELYRQQEIDEYWMVDWQNKKFEKIATAIPLALDNG